MYAFAKLFHTIYNPWIYARAVPPIGTDAVL